LKIAVILIISFLLCDAPFAQTISDSLKNERKKLSQQVNNPTAPLTQIQLRDVLTSNVPGYNGSANLFQIVPVMPIPRNSLLGFDQLMKITFQVPSTPNPNGETGFGDIDLFDLYTMSETWGRWGAGLSFVFPTASSENLGAGKWQIGPAVALMYVEIQNLVFGAVFQNPISFAGDQSRADVSALIITPTITWTFSNGWFAGYSDFDWTFDWKNDGQATIPLGLQAGKVVSLNSLPISLSIEGSWLAVSPDESPEWLFGFECVLIFPNFIK
jgi:hypothetical protein